MQEQVIHVAHEMKKFPWNRSISPAALETVGSESAAATRMIEAGATSVSLRDGSITMARPGRQPGQVLLATQEAIQRLRNIRSGAESHGLRPAVLACTGACLAQALASDDDPRDRRYLSGLTTASGFHVYCGGIEAAIRRACAYAPYADAVCYWTSHLSREEAEHFAREVNASHPDKDLGFGYCPKPHASGYSEADHLRFAEALAGSGYRYYFYRQFNTVVFPSTPAPEPWAFADDSAPGMLSD